MNPDKLLAKAKEKGILTKPESEYSKKEALGLVMLPGFSTNKTVTEFYCFRTDILVRIYGCCEKECGIGRRRCFPFQ